MDVRCATCSEPWDVDHLRYDEIYSVTHSTSEADAWLALPARQRLSEPYRTRFQQAGWAFGATVLTVLRCPCCPADARLDQEAAILKTVLEDVLGDDEDALAVELADLDR